MTQFFILALSFRGSERVATEFGARLDVVRPFDPTYRELFTKHRGILSLGEDVAPSNCVQLRHVGTTAVMRWMFLEMFSAIRLIVPQSRKHVSVDVEGIKGTFELDHAIICHSDAEKIDGVEGDDLIILLFFRGTPNEEEDNGESIRERFQSAAESWAFVTRLGIAGDFATHRFGTGYSPGVYFVPGNRIFTDLTQRNEIATGLSEPIFVQALSLFVAYLYYCWLICQRVERLANGIRVNGNWHEEYRKLILARKKLAVGQKFGFVKNRAIPNSPILEAFNSITKVFRLHAQLENAANLLDLTEKAIQAENAYSSNQRLWGIQIIIFWSSILVLGIGLNTITMEPFYEANRNALERYQFWMVFVVILALAGAVLVWISNWKRLRKLINKLSAAWRS